ncbi:uncharacterized protein LOC116402433 [Cucumis sativus]|uniref:uncharacterized protein LOC116402433 n=1 Tax=Cucumis sativus TaxID=3659 RepID=UPI0012F4A15B|nr:uncharacterized protein LOC116402433 [Cucumis sativus]
MREARGKFAKQPYTSRSAAVQICTARPPLPFRHCPVQICTVFASCSVSVEAEPPCEAVTATSAAHNRRPPIPSPPLSALPRRKPGFSQPPAVVERAFSLYDQINLIDNVPEDQLRFQRYTETGFTVNGVDYEGSLLCVGNLLMSWTPKKFSEITSDRFALHFLFLTYNTQFTSFVLFGD